ncbi:MAG TPA: hypothetical protein VIX17_18915 [Pyrinomonadaceae bacterium]|jgi:hypothetical protein
MSAPPRLFPELTENGKYRLLLSPPWLSAIELRLILEAVLLSELRKLVAFRPESQESKHTERGTMSYAQIKESERDAVRFIR